MLPRKHIQIPTGALFFMMIPSTKQPFRACTVALVTLISFAALSPVALAQKPVAALSPGEYVSEGGNGHLTIKPGKSGALNFAISSTGDNGHACSLEGELRNGKAKLEGSEEKKPCIVTMNLTPAGIDVKGGPGDACLIHCGMRATFEMVYFQPTPACVGAAVTKTRKAFKQRYDGKLFAEAKALLEPVLAECSRSLDWLESGRIRNDLAVTLHKLGDMKACRTVLQPLVEDARRTDAGVRENYPPTDAEMYLPIVRATRTNLKLCS
jgi:hypothetical protein